MSEIKAKVRNVLHTLLCLDRFSSPFEKVLLNYKIELVYFLSPCKWAQYLEKLNFIMTVWDLCHLDAPEFPEVRWKNELQLRETNYNSLLNRANAIFVDSEVAHASPNNPVNIHGSIHFRPPTCFIRHSFGLTKTMFI